MPDVGELKLQLGGKVASRLGGAPLPSRRLGVLPVPLGDAQALDALARDGGPRWRRPRNVGEHNRPCARSPSMDAYCLDRYSWKRMHRMPLLRAQRAIDCAEVAPVASTTIPATFQPALRPPGQRRGEAAPAVRGHVLRSHTRGR